MCRIKLLAIVEPAPVIGPPFGQGNSLASSLPFTTQITSVLLTLGLDFQKFAPSLNFEACIVEVGRQQCRFN